MPYPGWSATQIRQYKHIKAKLLAAGTSEDRAQEIAARTVNARKVKKAEQRQAKPMRSSALSGKSRMLRTDKEGRATYQPNSQYEIRELNKAAGQEERTMKTNETENDDVLKSLFNEELANDPDTQREARLSKALDGVSEDELVKALKRKGKKVQVSEDNTQPKAGSGGSAGAANGNTPVRPNGGVPQTTNQSNGIGVGGKGKMKKGGEGDDDSSGSDDGSDAAAPDMQKKVKKSMGGQVMYFAEPEESGDNYTADLIAKGLLGDGAIESMPLDVQQRVRNAGRL